MKRPSYKMLAYKQVKNKVTILDNNLNLITLNTNNGKVMTAFMISNKLLSPKTELV